MSRLRRIAGLLACVSLLVPIGSPWAGTSSSARLVALQAGLAAPEAAHSEAAALLERGASLAYAGEYAQAIAVFDQVVSKFGASADIGVKGLVARALNGKSFALGELGQDYESSATSDEVIGRFGTAADQSLEGAVAIALLLKGSVVAATAPYRAVTAYDQLISRFDNATDPNVKQLVAAADYGLLLSLVSESWSEWLNDPRFQEEAKRVQAVQTSENPRNRR